MQASQLYYTACERVRNAGFGVYSQSADIDAKNEASKLQEILQYPAPTGELFKVAEEDIPDRLPLKFAYFQLPTGRWCLGQSLYAGHKYSSEGGDRRHGNYFLHALVFDGDTLDVNPFLLYGSPLLKTKLTYKEWHDDPIERDMPRLELKGGEMAADAAETAAFFTNERARLLPYVVQAAFNSLIPKEMKDTGGNTVMSDNPLYLNDDFHFMKYWFCALGVCIPLSFAKRISFCSYNNDRSVTGSSFMPSIKVKCVPPQSRQFSYEAGGGQYAFDFENGIFNTDFPLSEYVTAVCKAFLENAQAAKTLCSGVDKMLSLGSESADEALRLYYLAKADTASLGGDAVEVGRLLRLLSGRGQQLSDKSLSALAADVSKGGLGADEKCVPVIEYLYQAVGEGDKNALVNYTVCNINSLCKTPEMIAKLLDTMSAATDDNGRDALYASFSSDVEHFCAGPQALGLLKKIYDGSDTGGKLSSALFFLENISLFTEGGQSVAELVEHFYKGLAEDADYVSDFVDFSVGGELTEKCTPYDGASILRHLYGNPPAASEGGGERVEYRKLISEYYLCNLKYFFASAESVVSTLEFFLSCADDRAYLCDSIIDKAFPLCNNSEICRLLKLIHTVPDRQSAADDYFSANADRLIPPENYPNEDYYAALTANRPYDNSEYLKRFDKPENISGFVSQQRYALFRALLTEDENKGALDNTKRVTEFLAAASDNSEVALFRDMCRALKDKKESCLSEAAEKSSLKDLETFCLFYSETENRQLRDRLIERLSVLDQEKLTSAVDYVRVAEGGMTSADYYIIAKKRYAGKDSFCGYLSAARGAYFRDSTEQTEQFAVDFFTEYFNKYRCDRRAAEYRNTLINCFEEIRTDSRFSTAIVLMETIKNKSGAQPFTVTDKPWLEVFARNICFEDFETIEKNVLLLQSKYDNPAKTVRVDCNIFRVLGIRLGLDYYIWSSQRELKAAFNNKNSGEIRKYGVFTKAVNEDRLFSYAVSKADFERINKYIMTDMLKVCYIEPTLTKQLIRHAAAEGAENFPQTFSDAMYGLSSDGKDCRYNIAAANTITFIDLSREVTDMSDTVSLGLEAYFKKLGRKRKELFAQIRQTAGINYKYERLCDYLDEYDRSNKSFLSRFH